MPKLYTRNQGGETRYYGDLRDIGGGQIALRPPGTSMATTDKAVAVRLLAEQTLALGVPPKARPRPSVTSRVGS